MQMMLEQLAQEIYPKQTAIVEDFLARLSALLEKGEGLKICEELLSLKYSGLLKLENQRYYSSKMLQGFLITTEGERSEQSSTQWMNWGMMRNGNCLTAQIMFHKTERVFIIGYLRGAGGQKIFPAIGGNKATLKQIIGGSQSERVYNPEGVSCTLSSQGGGNGAKTGLYLINKNKDGIKFREDFNCLDANYHKGLDCHQQRTGILEVSKTIRVGGRNSPYDSKQNWDKYKINGRIRRLTPLECFRLQGFPDELFYKARAVNSDTQLYKQAGNSVTVNVIYEIANKL